MSDSSLGVKHAHKVQSLHAKVASAFRLVCSHDALRRARPRLCLWLACCCRSFEQEQPRSVSLSLYSAQSMAQMNTCYNWSMSSFRMYPAAQSARSNHSLTVWPSGFLAIHQDWTRQSRSHFVPRILSGCIHLTSPAPSSSVCPFSVTGSRRAPSSSN